MGASGPGTLLGTCVWCAKSTEIDSGWVAAIWARTGQGVI